MIRRLRLLSGLVMLAYVTMHLANHAVGLISLKAMEDVLWYIFRIWTNRPAQLLLYSSFLVHYALALYALWQRRTLRLSLSELSQIVLGFAIPLLLVRHVVVTRISDSFFHTDVGYYAYLLWVYFVRSPDHGFVQMLVLVVAWAHAMIGLHFWLRVRPWYARLQPAALVAAVLVPVLSLLGAIEAGRQVIALAADPAWTREAFTLPSSETQHALETITEILSWFFAGVVGAVLLARLVRHAWRRRRGLVRIGYPDGRVVEVTPGTSVLEASRLAGIPHASVCGGRGRCSTCRVRVRGEIRSIDPPSEDELGVLRRIGATSNVRLACQLRPRGAIEVTPLLPPFAHAADGRRRVDFAQGSEREIAVMFVDIRGFTALSEGRLPYDVVFVLNRYFAAMGLAVEAAGGHVDKFIGDGVMALFGIERGAQAGCREALTAARLMSERLPELNASLRAELDRPLRIGIGVHCGPTIVGEMGYGNAAAITAIGDAVNTASRLESLTKNFACELVVSEETVSRAGLDLSAFPQREIEIRGKREMLAVRTFVSAAELPAAVLTTRHRPSTPGVKR
jgi:adenylate cyclase